MYGDNKIDELIREANKVAAVPVDWGAYVDLYDDPWGPSPYSRVEDRNPVLSPARQSYRDSEAKEEVDVYEPRVRQRARTKIGRMSIRTGVEGDMYMKIVDERV